MTLGIKDITERYGVGEHTVLAWIHSGELKAVNVGRKPGGKPKWRITPEALASRGGEFVLVFDFDEKAATRNRVRKAETHLAQVLKDHGAAEVLRVDLPPGPNGAKQGADDFLVAHGPEAFKSLVAEAEPVLQERREGGISCICLIVAGPPELDEDAYDGFVGRFIRAVAPYTEATDAGTLAHFLPAVGTMFGPGAFVYAGQDQPPRIDTILVGSTSNGRKGTSKYPVKLLFDAFAPQFVQEQWESGLSSGEGLILRLCDKVKRDKDGNEEIEPVDKRVYVVEPEFSKVLAHMRRDGNILSHILRELFDSGDVGTLTREPLKTTGAHVCVTGHITPEELKRRLCETEMANKFANRFLWCPAPHRT